MIKLAKILHIDDATVTIKLEQNNQCSDCESHCSDGFLRFLFNKQNKDVLNISRVKESLNAHLWDDSNFFDQGYKVDDVIGLNFDETHLLKLTLLLYGLPIILIVATLICGYLAFQFLDLNADFGGILGFIGGLISAKYLIEKNSKKNKPNVKFFK